MAKKKAAKKATKKATKATKIPQLQGNGLATFGMHAGDKRSAKAMSALAAERATSPAFGFAPATAALPHDPETAARRYLEQALASSSVPSFIAPVANNLTSDFARLGVERIPLTDTTTVKFRQTFNNVPVYGSLVTVELDDSNKLIGIDSALGTPQGVSPVAKIAPAEAVAAVKKLPGAKKDLTGAVPRLNYYYDQGKSSGKWKLVYIMEDIPVVPKSKKGEMVPVLMDYVVDAHTGKLVAELDRTPTAAVKVTLPDDFGAQREIQVDKVGAVSTLINNTLNVQTFDFKKKDPVAQATQLPGTIIKNPPTISPAAVSAHANAEAVSRFLRTTLQRNNIDNNGGPLVSSINCIYQDQSPDGQQWINAFWNGTQMAYGLRKNGASTLSMAAAIDVVAHENFHGVTDRSARLIYRFQSGALNESYSDIFGIIVKNQAKADTGTWNWDIGAGLLPSGQPFRNMADPTLHGQPAHMANYRNLPLSSDQGGVHINSGIHNKAAFNILTAKKSGTLVFKPTEVAILFYLALTQRLSRTSQFKDSRAAVIASARSFFRNFSAAQIATRVTAIEAGFNAVGIV